MRKILDKITLKGGRYGKNGANAVGHYYYKNSRPPRRAACWQCVEN